jgi:tetratricopeptide (TPR) repeat protein
VLGVAIAFAGEPEAGETHLRSALRLAEEVGKPEDLASVRLDLADVLRLQGRIQEALNLMTEGELLANRLGAEGAYGSFMAINAADDLFVLGRWDEAKKCLARVEHGQLSPNARLFRAIVAGRIAVGEGRSDVATRHLESAHDLAATNPVGEFVLPLRTIRAELDLWRGHVHAAREEISCGIDALVDGEHLLYAPALLAMGVRVEADGAQVARARGLDPLERSSAARSLFTMLDRLAGAAPTTAHLPELEAQRDTAKAELARFEDSPAPDLWRHSADLWQALQQPYPEAYARWREAQASLSTDVGEAGALAALHRANELATRLGAAALLSAIRHLVRDTRL